MLNLKAIRTYAIDKNESKDIQYLIAPIPYSEYFIKASRLENEYHICVKKAGFFQSVGKVFEERVFILDIYQNAKELFGLAQYVEELGLTCIEKYKLERDCPPKQEEARKRVFKI